MTEWPSMKALSLTQPWADLMVRGLKRFETRSWKTSYSGLLIIHASKRFPRWCKDLLEEEPFLSALNCPSVEMPTGAIIGAVDLKRCWATDDLIVSTTERQFGDYDPNRFAWETDNPRMCQPIPCKGSLGLWTPTADIQRLVRERIET